MIGMVNSENGEAEYRVTTSRRKPFNKFNIKRVL
jgi:hypothetical protein